MQNIVTWGQNMSANIEEFACISMGGLFSGVPPQTSAMPRDCLQASNNLFFTFQTSTTTLSYSKNVTITSI